MSEGRIELGFELLDRGIVWQSTVFFVIGIVVTVLLAVYSGLDTLAYRILDTATTRMNWAFVPMIAFLIDWSRNMILFERATDIRARAIKKYDDKLRQEVRQEESERIRSELEANGVVIPPEVAESIFNQKNGHKS